jgi:hypothetical protein
MILFKLYLSRADNDEYILSQLGFENLANETPTGSEATLAKISRFHYHLTS